VDLAGKLFERLNANETDCSDKPAQQTNLSISGLTASFCQRHENHQVRDYRSAGFFF
jgi:hypothetical protein